MNFPSLFLAFLLFVASLGYYAVSFAMEPPLALDFPNPNNPPQEFRPVSSLMLEKLNKERERVVFIYGEQQITAGEFHDRVYNMARALESLGIGRGKQVTMLSDNRLEIPIVRHAVSLLGGCYMHGYSGLSVDDQARLINDAKTSALIIDPRLSEQAAKLISKVRLEHVLGLGPTNMGKDLLELEEEQAKKQHDIPFTSPAQPEDVGLFRFTSGTTGVPKVIPSTFGNLLAQLQRQLKIPQESHRQLICTSIAHAAGYLADLTLYAGGTVVLMDQFEAGKVLEMIEHHKITSVWLTPAWLCQLLDHPDIKKRDTSSLKKLMYGGAPISSERLAQAVKRFGKVLYQFYGQIEAGAISILTPEMHTGDLLGSAGQILAGVDVQIRDEAGKVLPPGSVGEICVRSDSIMKGYLNQPELTASVLRDGWLHTGDLGSLNKNVLTILGRLKEMIKGRDLSHVYPTLVEEVIRSHPKVKDCVVFGVLDRDGIEEVHASIVLNSGSKLDMDELCKFVRNKKGAMHVPTRVKFIAEIPLTDMGKPDKKLLQQQAYNAACSR